MLVESGESAALAIYDKLLSSIAARRDAIGAQPLASQWPHVGTAYRGLAIVGQSLQGWDRAVTGARWQVPEVETAEGRRRVIELTRTWHRAFAEPIAPIAELPNRRNSPFWRLCADLVKTLEPNGPRPWYSRFAWTNVYPVGPDYSPTAGAGSPWGALKDAQDQYVGPLLRATMEALDARRVIVVCGPQYWLAPSRVEFAALTRERAPLLATGELDGRTWVVGYHPGYARRMGFGAAGYAELLVDAVRRVEAH